MEEHPIKYLEPVTQFLDRMIQDHGDSLFVVLTFLCLGIIIWIFLRPRKRPVHDISVTILPLGQAPRRDPEQDLPPFEEHSGL
jgi:cbb3-type cytochrome oxidase subunit 3